MAADSPAHLETMKAYAAQMMKAVPWANELGLEVTTVERGCVIGKLPYSEHLVGDPITGIVHGGVVTSLLDNLCGTAVVAALTEFKSTATLDLRIDYMRPAEKGRAIIGEAECYHTTRTVAFVRAWAYHESKDRVIATAAGAFALNDPSDWTRPRSGKGEGDAAR
ncbi:MAG: PaaI family thioesterase [Pseudomonadota bacterium]